MSLHLTPLLAAILAAAVVVGAPRLARAADPPDPDPWFGRDKGLHFAVSAGLAVGGYGFGALAVDDVAARVAIGASIALGAGVAKEILDAAGFGDPSFRDLAWDLAGTAVGIGFAVTFDLALRQPAPRPRREAYR